MISIIDVMYLLLVGHIHMEINTVGMPNFLFLLCRIVFKRDSSVFEYSTQVLLLGNTEVTVLLE